MKRCFKCGEIKPRDEFYRHAQMGDGLLGKCKQCTKKDVNLYRRTNPKNVAQTRRRYLESPAGREAMRRRSRRWAEAHRDGRWAQGKVAYALLRGRLTRQACSVCGRTDSHAHHQDYQKPLDVMWLCPVHHAEQHVREGRMSYGPVWQENEPRGKGAK